MFVLMFQMLLNIDSVNFKVCLELCFDLKAQNLMSPEHTYDATNMKKINPFHFPFNNEMCK